MKESKNLAIIGASYLQLPLIVKAKDMGYTTHVFAWAADDVGEIAADYFYPISIVEKEDILNSDGTRRIKKTNYRCVFILTKDRLNR